MEKEWSYQIQYKGKIYNSFFNLAMDNIRFLCSLVILQVVAEPVRIDECQTVCDEQENPVCAICNDSMKNFTNACFVRKENNCFQNDCEVIKEGYCSPLCSLPCTNEYDPKCAWNGKNFKTFNSFCRLIVYNECYEEKYQTVSNGRCEDLK